MSARNMAKRTAAGTLALAVCLGGGAIALASAASADANFKFDTRIAGDDRYQTAIAASKAAFPADGSAQNVILVNGYATVDGLTASYLAGVANAPILYVSDQGADAATKAEIKRLGAKNIWLVGGTTVIPTSVETAIKGDGYTVSRISGEDRYETAAAIAEAGMKMSGKKPSKVFVASGTSFADALAVSPVAYGKGYPIILTDKDKTSDASKKELGIIGTDTKILVGGTAVVSDSVAKDLTVSTRVAGDDRAVTANLVSDWAKKSEGFNPANAILVGGTNGNGADSLVASALGAKSFSTLHFAGWDATATYFKDHANELTGKGFVFGGKAAVSDGQVSAAQSAAQFVAAVSTSYTVSQDAKVVSSLTGTRTYTVSGVTAGKPVFVAMVTSSALINGLPLDTAKRNADLTTSAAAARITAVNNVSVSAATTLSYTPDSSSFSFTVTGNSAAETLVPIVFDNTDGNSKLSLNVAGTPKEAYGIGGTTQFKAAAASEPAEAASGTQTISTNTAKVNAVYADGFTVKDTANSSTVVSGTYKWKSGDTYKLGSQAITKAQFLSILSVGDVIADFTYYSDPSGSQSAVYSITTDAAPTAVAPTVTASTTKLGQVTVTYGTDTEFAPGTQYVLQRQQTDSSGAAVSGSAGVFTAVDTRTVSTGDDQTFTETLAAGYYKYKLVISSPGFSGTASSEAATSSATQVTTTATLSAPGVTRLYLTSNASDINNLSKGDTFKIVLTQPVNQPVAGSVFTLGSKTFTSTDAATSSAGGAVKLTVNTSTETVDGVAQDAGKVLTVTLLADPVGASAGTTAPLAFSTGLQLTSSTGIGNNAGALPTQSGAWAMLMQDVVS